MKRRVLLKSLAAAIAAPLLPSLPASAAEFNVMKFWEDTALASIGKRWFESPDSFVKTPLLVRELAKWMERHGLISRVSFGITHPDRLVDVVYWYSYDEQMRFQTAEIEFEGEKTRGIMAYAPTDGRVIGIDNTDADSA